MTRNEIEALANACLHLHKLDIGNPKDFADGFVMGMYYYQELSKTTKEIPPLKTTAKEYPSKKVGSHTWMTTDLDVDDGLGGIHVCGEHTYYTWDAAVRVAESIPGWHLPSVEEYKNMLSEFDGNIVGQYLHKMPDSIQYNGYMRKDGCFNGFGIISMLWTADTNWDNQNAYDESHYIRINRTQAYWNSGCNTKLDCLTVRLVKDE